MGPNTAAVRLNKRSPPLSEGSVNQLTAGRRLLYAICLLGAQGRLGRGGGRDGGGKLRTTKNVRAVEKKRATSCADKDDIERASNALSTEKTNKPEGGAPRPDGTRR